MELADAIVESTHWISFDFHPSLAQLIAVMLLFSLTSCVIIDLATCVLLACLPLLVMESWELSLPRLMFYVLAVSLANSYSDPIL